MGTPELTRRLNELFAEELEASLRYLHMAATLEGPDEHRVAELLLEGVQETIEHARGIAEKIVELGEAPALTLKVSLPARRIGGREAIREALVCEEEALVAYQELLADVGPTPAMEEFLRAQIALESEHVQALSLLLDD